MKTIINYTRYDFEIILDVNSGSCYFSILAICKQTGRCSSINNLNKMLADLNVDPNNPKYEDSSWMLSVREGKKLFNRTVSLFDKSYSTFLEDELDEDRECGEWENYISQPS